MRWMLPLMSVLTGHRVVLILLIQALLGCGFLYLLTREVFSQTQDKVLAAFFALGVSNLFVFSWFFVDTAGYGDGFAYFFLLLALLVRNPILLFVFLQFAFFTDERAIVAGGYVALWWITRRLMEKNDFRFLSVVKSSFIPTTWVILAAWVSYGVFRSYIMRTYFSGHDYSTVGSPVLFSDEHRWGLGSSLWSSFEGAWLLLGLTAYVLYTTRRRWFLLLLLLGFLVLLTTGLFVHDIDRALGYGFPFLLICSLVLSRSVPLPEFKKAVFVMAVICLIHPLCYTLGYNKIIWAEPLPMKIFMALDRLVGLGWFD